jgi:hypothetical protein
VAGQVIGRPACCQAAASVGGDDDHFAKTPSWERTGLRWVVWAELGRSARERRERGRGRAQGRREKGFLSLFLFLFLIFYFHVQNPISKLF